MHALIADAILAGRAELLDTLRVAGPQRPRAFRTLLAFDLIVEADGTPLLMEINPYPGMTPQSEWHSAYLRQMLDSYIGACVEPPMEGSDGAWKLLLGRGVSSVDFTGPAAVFDVVPCGSRLVRSHP